jgi:hypothetical protein
MKPIPLGAATGAVFFVAAWLAPPVAAQSHPPESQDGKPAGHVGGVWAYIDPKTGALTEPSNQGDASWSAKSLRAPDATKMREEQLADGTVLLHLNGQFHMGASVRRTPDGRFEATCTATDARQDETR